MECDRLVDIVDGWAIASVTGYAGGRSLHLCWHQISNVEGINNNKLKLLKCSGFWLKNFKTLKFDLCFFDIFLKI